MDAILQNTEKFVLNYLNENLDAHFSYHNYEHAHYVVSKINEIIHNENLTEDEIEIVNLAGWLHDVGYCKSKTNHENYSISIAENFLKNQNYDVKKTEKVLACIKATIPNTIPEQKLHQIICDADYAHMASSNYFSYSNKLKIELENTNNIKISKKEWFQDNIKVFNNHKYFTKYAKINWNTGKYENLKILLSGLKKTIKKETNLEAENRSERSIDTLFRVTLRNHITLSDIADTKANILLSVNAIIISMALSNLIPKFDNPANRFLIIPTVIFLTFSVISMVLSVIATNPSVTTKDFSKEDILNKKVNLLFFGNFNKLSLEEFEKNIKVIMNDKYYLYTTMTKDLHALGKVLDRKYKILRWTYTIFMIGIILSVLAFGISYYSIF